MAEAYASLVSLLNTMDLIQNHPHLSNSFNYPKESLREKIDFLVDFVEKYSDADSTEAEDLVRRIAVAAHNAEDIIEVEAADRIRAASTQQSPSFLPDLQKIIQDMDFIKENVIKAKEETRFITRQPTSSVTPPSSSASPATAKATTMVGFNGYLEQLLDELTGKQSDRRILPVVGMGGIGKTTLARNVYENLLTVHHFDVRAWIIVSQEFSARDIILQALSCLGGSTSKTDKTDDQLGQELYRILYGRRYLIVLDDIWSVEAWNKMKFFFPENNNRSRIVITTRQSELVDYFGSSAIAVDFLDEKNSWDLFCDKTFGLESCPPELEQVGKKIVKRCKGLPLEIVVIGGLLRKSSRTQEYWEEIAKDKSLILDSGEGSKPSTSSILYLSYKHLPVWLKSCFLYFRLFPEDSEIEGPDLINLWVAEGFIKPNLDQSLEEVAESYIKELVDRNLILVRYLKLNKKVGACYVHDLVRELCIRIAEKENCFYVQRDIDGSRHYIVDETTAKLYRHSSKTPSLLRPLIVHAHQGGTSSFKSRLLRVLVGDEGHQDSTFRQVNLRFLLHESPIRDYELPSSLSLLWSLQTLSVMNDMVVAPSEIWNMPQLRHIRMQSIYLPDPPPSDEHDDVIVLQNLQTIMRARNLNFSEEVCKRIPNIKELFIHYEFDESASSIYNLQNVGFLNKLESLRYSFSGWEYLGGDVLLKLNVPNSLKELDLSNSKLAWSDMAVIASLPHLQILELQHDAMVGPEWNCVEEEFLCLKHLYINECHDLIHWTADSCNFPVLENLSLVYLSELVEIPSGIGEIPTLEEIYMDSCSESATISAIKIVEEQESLGNLSLQLRLNVGDEKRAEMWRGKIEELGFTGQNLRITTR
ncbi:hypothetical protein C2S51_018531 [Perilla frutescens var. frutescens]|nr:hypothetical protein C2S51_018531 [Perilla frutescens var. frutescens]